MPPDSTFLNVRSVDRCVWCLMCVRYLYRQGAHDVQALLERTCAGVEYFGFPIVGRIWDLIEIRPRVAGANNGTCGSAWKDNSHRWSLACSCGYLWVLSRECVRQQVRAWLLYARGVSRCQLHGFRVHRPSRVLPGTMPNSSVQSVAMYHAVQCLLASKGWLMQPGVPGAWPCFNMVGRWHCVCGNIVAALVAVWCLLRLW